MEELSNKKQDKKVRYFDKEGRLMGTIKAEEAVRLVKVKLAVIIGPAKIKQIYF